MSMRKLIFGMVISMILLSCGCTKKNQEIVKQKAPIVIGMQADLTGGLASWGYWNQRAAQVAVEQINKNGGVKGRPIKLIVEDTETNPAVGVRKLRKMILKDNAAFIIGSVHSGVMMASLKLAKEYKRIYIPFGMASEATDKPGNRYVFRISTHVREQVEASADWVVNDPHGPHAKKWTIVVADYQWGWSHEEWFSKKVIEEGGEILKSIRVPTGTKDFFPYISQIPKDTEAIYFIFFGSDSVGFIQQLYEKGYRGEKFTVICTLEAIDLKSLGPAIEGTWVLEYFPRNLAQSEIPEDLLKTFRTPYSLAFRKAIGADEYGYEINHPERVIACSHCWIPYEIVYMLKDAIEATNWRDLQDNEKIIHYLEGHTLKLSYQFPQGDNLIRAEDHQGFHNHWMSHVENGMLYTKFIINKENVVYPPPVDFRNLKHD